MTGTNQVPSQAEAHTIRFYLQELVETMPPSVSDTRDQQALRDLLSPARRVAPELLAHIFELCLPSDRSESAYRSYEAPLLVCQICSGWRQVALSTPQLWNHINVVLPLARLAPASWVLQINQASFSSLVWLSRARASKLFISITSILSGESNLSSKMWFPAATALVARLLAQYGRQIERLSLELPIPCTLPLLRSNCPSLKRLKILDYGAWYPTTDDALQHVESTVPLGVGVAEQLHDVIITIPHLCVKRTRLPWAHLTHATIKYSISLTSCLILLRTCQRLHTLRLHVEGSMELSTGIGPAINHSIRELGVYGHPSESGATILDAIEVPNLKKLIIGDDYDLGSLLSFLKRLRRPLLSLSFKNILWMPEEELVLVLQLIPSLKELFSNSTFHNHLLEMLTPVKDEDESTVLCPLLESVELRLQLSNEQVVDFIQARSATSHRSLSVARLKRAHLTFMSPHHRHESWNWDEAAWIQKVAQWRGEGMDLVLSDHNWENTPFNVVYPDEPEAEEA
ncbi:hypothetical protein HWV62_14440 [Athelia sp. TMB]|nr:hypothetical protein HWV62_40923 [Athelia sp. TMB]KAF7984401.1 hypothetical protein HWV62_14440 [Athelia sp. TMB]